MGDADWGEMVMELSEQMEADGMIRRVVRVLRHEVVYVKCIVEAYPGLASILAPPRRSGEAPSDMSRLVLAFHPGVESEVDAMLRELSDETGLVLETPW